jgi:hypothetical protein
MANDTAKPEAEAKRSKQGRSPAYPGLTIKMAIEKAQALYDAEGKYPAPMPSAFKAWGFSEKSSGGREVRASLRYFGLISVDGDSETGKVKLTEEALRIILDAREDQTEKKALIRRLAMLPAIHKKLIENFPDGLKSDDTVEHYLKFDEGYSGAAAAEVLAEFKDTATYAGIFQPAADSGIIRDQKRNDPAIKTAKEGIEDDASRKSQQVKLMDGERVVFTEESAPQVYLKLVATGELDEYLLEALDNYVKRQRKRLKIQPEAESASDKASA